MLSIGNNPHEEKEALLLSPIAISGALDGEEIKLILDLVESLELSPGTVDGDVNSSHRSCKVGWLQFTDETAWVYGRMYDLVCLGNAAAFYFDPIDFVEPIMYVEYEEGDHFNWHFDLAAPPPFSSRKIAVTVQLSDSDDYRGGCLEFCMSPENSYTVTREKGSVIMYPTYLIHRIQPVTKGKRKSLVLWVGGTSFR